MSKGRKSKSVERRVAAQTSEKTETTQKKSGNVKVSLVALQNTQLADGTFVKKGAEVEVTKEYADAVLQEVNPHFAPA